MMINKAKQNLSYISNTKESNSNNNINKESKNLQWSYQNKKFEFDWNSVCGIIDGQTV